MILNCNDCAKEIFKMKKIVGIISLLSAITALITSISVSAADKQRITVHNTEKHGIYVTVDEMLIDCDESELPFIDENDRTQVPIRAVSESFGKNVSYSDENKTIYLADGNNDGGDNYLFTIGSNKMRKNESVITMDTQVCVMNGHTFIPLYYLGEALNCDVEYTKEDIFEDITITCKSEFAGSFNQADTVTVWGNIQKSFYEGCNLDSLVPYEGESPDLNNNNIYEYEVVFTSSDNNTSHQKFSVYWDTLYNKAYVTDDNNIIYMSSTDFPRLLKSLLEIGKNKGYAVGSAESRMFDKYGWSLEYKINTVEDNLPQMNGLGEFSPNEYYYLYNNELSKDIGLDMSKYSGKNVTVDIYYIKENMPEKFYPIQDARGIIVRYNSDIIGAYISSGRHQIENSCSLNRKDFEEITKKDFSTFITPLLKEEPDKIIDKPQEIIERYFKALEDNDEKTARDCISKTTMFSGLTANIFNSELYNKKIGLPLTNKTFMKENEKSADNIKSIDNLAIKEFESDDVSETYKTYTVTFDAEYEQEETISNGIQYWQCCLIYESDKTGWKIAGFGH